MFHPCPVPPVHRITIHPVLRHSRNTSLVRGCSNSSYRSPRITDPLLVTSPSHVSPLLLCAQFLKITCGKRRKKKEEDKESAQFHAITRGRNKSSWTKNDGREREKTEKRQLAFDVLTERARRRRRSRLFRNDDAPASRIAEGLHCASAARASSTQPPRASSSLLRNRRSNTFAQPRVRVPGSLEYGWGARMRMRAAHLCRACVHSSLAVHRTTTLLLLLLILSPLLLSSPLISLPLLCRFLSLTLSPSRLFRLLPPFEIPFWEEGRWWTVRWTCKRTHESDYELYGIRIIEGREGSKSISRWPNDSTRLDSIRSHSIRTWERERERKRDE